MTSLVIGASSVAQLDANLDALDNSTSPPTSWPRSTSSPPRATSTSGRRRPRPEYGRVGACLKSPNGRNRPRRRVTWTELFFDLVLVFAITQITALLHEDHGWAALGQALIVFVPIYWAWVGTSVHCNLHDTDNAVDRAGILALALCALFMAVAVPAGVRAAGCAVRRGVLRAAGDPRRAVLPRAADHVGHPAGRRVCHRPTDAGRRAGAHAGRTVLWGLAAVVDLATPRVLRRRLMAVAFDAGHLVERFGLFVIIALGESVVDIGASAARAEPLTVAGLLAVAASFVLAAGLWWVYFVYATSADPARAVDRPDPDRHRPSGVQLGPPVLRGRHHRGGGRPSRVVAHPTTALGPGPAALLFGGTGLYLATFGYTRWRMFHTWAKTRLTTAAVVLALLPLAHLGPALLALGRTRRSRGRTQRNRACHGRAYRIGPDQIAPTHSYLTRKHLDMTMCHC